jgi:hypothetical protein
MIPIEVRSTPIDLNYDPPNILSPVDRFFNDIIFGGGPNGEPLDRVGSDNPEAHRGLYYNPFPRPRENSQSPPSSVPSQNPPPPTPSTPATAPAPGSPPAPSAPTAGVFIVVASEFAGGSDYPLRSAYGPYDSEGRGPIINPNRLGASLPFRFPSNNSPPGIIVMVMSPQSGLTTSAPILDVGPWNVRDNYWSTGAAPLTVSQFAANSRGQNGQIVTNPAGIDLTPATKDAIGATGPVNSRQVEVMWWFLTDH